MPEGDAGRTFTARTLVERAAALNRNTHNGRRAAHKPLLLLWALARFARGDGLARTRRPSGSTRIRIDAPDPRAAEQQVSDFIAGGAWRWVACTSKEEAQALQGAAIEALDPLLNRDRRARPADERLVAALAGAPAVPHPSADPPDSPGVYALYHDVPPG